MGQWFAQLSGEVQLAIIALVNVLSVAIITAWREARKPPPFTKENLGETKSDLALAAAAMEGLTVTLIELKQLVKQGRSNDEESQRVFREILDEVEQVRGINESMSHELRELRVELIRGKKD